jgi:hypothetical protein
MNLTDHVDALVAYGFSSEESNIALDECGGDLTASLVLLLQRLAPKFERDAATASTALDDAIAEEAVALDAIYADAFTDEMLPGGVRCLSLTLSDLQPVAGELRLLVPPGTEYPTQACLPIFVSSEPLASLDAAGVRVSLARALAEQAARLAADAAPACYELSMWLADELSSFLEDPPRRPPQLVLTAKQQARQEHDARIGALHKAAAEEATQLERHREREAAAHGLTFEEYLKATDSWPVSRGAPDPAEVAALKARLALGPSSSVP